MLASDCKESFNVPCSTIFGGKALKGHWQRVSESDTGELQSVPVEPEVGFGGNMYTCVSRARWWSGAGKVERWDEISVERGVAPDGRSCTCICRSHDQKKISCHSWTFHVKLIPSMPSRLLAAIRTSSGVDSLSSDSCSTRTGLREIDIWFSFLNLCPMGPS